jgi:4'-phosphopantetheinyl transferase
VIVTVRWSLGAVGHDLLRATVADVAGVAPVSVALHQVCHRCGGPHGRPRVDVDGRPGPSVSLTHSGEVAAVAVAGVPVGIDLEPIERVGADIEAVLLSPREQRAWSVVAPTDRPQALLRTWVRKEALLKATGEGLAIDPRLVELGPPGDRPTLTGWSAELERPPVRLVDLDLGPRYLATVAALTTDDLDLDVSEVG